MSKAAYLTRELRSCSLLAPLSNDEYLPPAPCRNETIAAELLRRGAERAARRLALPLEHYLASRMGTAAALAAINAAGGRDFYAVRPSLAEDREEATQYFDRGELVIDVQTHFVADHRVDLPGAQGVHHFIRHVAPDIFRGLDTAIDLSFEQYLRCIFLQSETSLAVLTAAPGTDDSNILSNREIAGARELVDRLAGSDRLLHHSIVHPNVEGELDNMARIVERHRPNGFKVYTLYGDSAGGGRGWRLDDPQCGLPFLARARELGVGIICAHKGLSNLAPTGSPADVGPAAAAFPDLNFLIYHSGYEVPRPQGHGEILEGPFPGDATPDAMLEGTDRLVASLRDAGVGPGANVYAELGSTWYLLVRRPQEAAHVLGKLLLAVGEDNILWGTDSVWYGSAQPLIDAFRAFEIPDEYRERFGYPALTPTIKRKILGLNAARVYGVDAERALTAAQRDELGWLSRAVAEFSRFEAGAAG